MFKSKSALVIAIVILGVSVFAMFFQIPYAQTSPTIVAYKVVGTSNLGNPGSESFWSKIPWVNLSLTANIPNAPTSGLVKYVLVKAAWNGTDLFILEEWQSPSPAYGAWSDSAAAIYPEATGPDTFRIIELTPGVTYKLLTNYTNYVSIINGKTETGRLLLNYSGITLPLPNDTQIQTLPNGTILLYHSPRPLEDLLYSDGMFYGYYVNSTWYYPDRAAIMWYLGTGVPSQDCMNLGGKVPDQTYDGFTLKYAGGSMAESGIATNIWMWVTGATWNSTNDPAFKVNLWQNTSLTGLSYTDPHNHGFAVPLYSNNTNLYEVDTAGIWYTPVKSSGLNGSLFYIWTGATWENGTWVLEWVYPLNVPSDYLPYFVNITANKIYYVAFAVWQGTEGETAFDKSISPSFVTLELVNQAPPTSTTTSTTSPMVSTTSPATTTIVEIPFTDIVVTIAGVIVAIVAVAILALLYRK